MLIAIQKNLFLIYHIGHKINNIFYLSQVRKNLKTSVFIRLPYLTGIRKLVFYPIVISIVFCLTQIQKNLKK